MLYRTECPSCSACEPIRIPVQNFKRSKSMRKIWNKNQDLQVKMIQTRYSSKCLNLYNRHKMERGLSRNETNMTRSGYENWFVFSCVPTAELHYYLGDKLICVSILDIGKKDTSSVYVFFDPDYSSRSLGTFSVLYEIDWMLQRGMRYYYLGLYVAPCQHLNYKARFFPHDRLVSESWHRFQSKSVSIDQAQIVPHQEDFDADQLPSPAHENSNAQAPH